ncbi:MAG: (Fe-S)-binding protein, partial [Planctomycetota bacterium]|nr:(Fe-S)-binding protein [Planctomycetota bacterium]
MQESTEKTQNSDTGVREAVKALREAVQALGAYHLNACVRCGLCGETCHVYLAEPEPENLPGAKAAKVAAHYRRYHTFLGRLIPALVGAREVTAESLDELVESVFGRCTGCGRCGFHCTIGLDVAGVIRIGRRMLAVSGRTPESLLRVVRSQIETGNQMAIPREELIATAEWLSQDLQTETGDPQAKLHLDEKGKRIMYLVNPREVKFFPLSLMAAAGVFHAARESWTISSKVYDVTNYGFFAADNSAAAELTRRVMDEARQLGVQEVVVSECGHGFRSFRWEGPNWTKAKYEVRVRSVLELLDDYIGTGRIKVDPGKNTEKVTLHDPCNLVRWGGIVAPQRRVLGRVVKDFVEMTPNRLNNYCCGGGGGMLAMAEYSDRRVASGKAKAEQIRKTGAKIVACPCHNCADQLTELSK